MALGVGQATTFQVGDSEFEVEIVRASPARGVEVFRDPGVKGADGAIPLRRRRGHLIDCGLLGTAAPWIGDATALARLRTPVTNCSFCACAGAADR